MHNLHMKPMGGASRIIRESHRGFKILLSLEFTAIIQGAASRRAALAAGRGIRRNRSTRKQPINAAVVRTRTAHDTSEPFIAAANRCSRSSQLGYSAAFFIVGVGTAARVHFVSSFWRLAVEGTAQTPMMTRNSFARCLEIVLCLSMTVSSQWNSSSEDTALQRAW